MEKPFNIIFLGLSGSGKGTQVEMVKKILENRFPMRVIETGALFRALANEDTDVSRRVRETLEKGGLPFDDLATALWMREIAFTVKKEDGIIFDGAPRRVAEAENIDRFFDFLERKNNTRILYLHVTPEEAKRRLLLRGRGDDTESAIEGRMAFFRDFVMPVLNYYRDGERLIEVNGEQGVDDVHNDIVKALGL